MALDLTSDPDGDADAHRPRAANEPATDPRPFLGIHFECCGLYGRIYRDPNFRVYRGRCPKCLRSLEIPIGQGGRAGRFYRAS